MPFFGRRLEREYRIVAAMVEVFCRDRHASRPEACAECSGLIDYARRRLERCPYGERKPTCANCPIHCYQPRIREQIREVMRHAGPRMLLRHPIMALRHWFDGRREAPVRPERERERA